MVFIVDVNCSAENGNSIDDGSQIMHPSKHYLMSSFTYLALPLPGSAIRRICNLGLVLDSFKKADRAVNPTPMTELQNVTCHVGSHSVTCYPTQVNAPHPNPSCRGVLDLPTREGWKAELT